MPSAPARTSSPHPTPSRWCRFIELAAAALSWGALEWKGKGVNAIGRRNTGAVVVRIDPGSFRPVEVDTLLGDPTKARNGGARP